LNDTKDRSSAVLVTGLTRVRSIAAGETHAAALTADGISGWGNNAAGQIGTAESKQLCPTPFFALA
jgi:alpha-tubulin suppressor-like RCC1 family protein